MLSDVFNINDDKMFEWEMIRKKKKHFIFKNTQTRF